jgi:hypothetical protein
VATTEQAAHETLEAAIERFLEETGHGGLLLDWVVVTQSLVAVDGQEGSRTAWAGGFPQALYRSLGLVEHAATQIRAQIAAPREE